MNIYGSEAYNVNSHTIPRTTLASSSKLSRQGHLQNMIMYVITKYQLIRFTISNIQKTIEEEFNIKIDRRRLWDAFQRLVKRGLIVREKIRGWYKVLIDIRELDISFFIDKLRDFVKKPEKKMKNDPKDKSWDSHCFVDRFVDCCYGCGSVGVLRVHSNAVGVFDFYRFVLFVSRLLEAEVSRLERFLVGFYGVSRSVVRRVRREVFSLVKSVVSSGSVVLGCHGRFGRSVRVGSRDRLVPISMCQGGGYEKGFDIEVPMDLALRIVKVLGGRPFVKIYLYPRSLSYAVKENMVLTRWVR